MSEVSSGNSIATINEIQVMLREYGRISNSSRIFRVAPEFKSTSSVAKSNPAQEGLMKQQEVL